MSILFELKWATRKPRKHLHWVFGRKYYWMYYGAIVKVVIRERNGKLIDCMQKRDGQLNFFSCNESSIFRTKDEAIKAMIELHSLRIKDVESYWESKIEKLGWER